MPPSRSRSHPWLDPDASLATVLTSLPANLQRDVVVLVVDRLGNTSAQERKELVRLLGAVALRHLSDQPAQAAVIKALASLVSGYTNTARSLEQPQ